MKLSVRVQVNSMTREVRQQAAGWAMDFAHAQAETGAQYARDLVSPGVGPGPHPHVTDHEDTGNLADNIFVEDKAQGFLSTSAVSTDVEYGLDLEMGWHAPSGGFYRYPWLEPSVKRAVEEGESIARSTIKRWFNDDGSYSKAGVF